MRCCLNNQQLCQQIYYSTPPAGAAQLRRVKVTPVITSPTNIQSVISMQLKVHISYLRLGGIGLRSTIYGPKTNLLRWLGGIGLRMQIALLIAIYW